jgi:hypothetical protein
MNRGVIERINFLKVRGVMRMLMRMIIRIRIIKKFEKYKRKNEYLIILCFIYTLICFL